MAPFPAPRFLAVDFFCGAGGTTRGLLDAGGYVIAGIDKETRCKETYVENNSNGRLDGAKPQYLEYDIFPKTAVYPQGQQAELTSTLDSLITRYRTSPSIPLLFAICAPCQPFTTLARKELSETRKEKRERDSNLLSEAAKFVDRYRPEMVLSENVAGIGDPRYGGIWTEFQTELVRLGYHVGARQVCASNFGIAQKRKRSILLAVRSDLIGDGRQSPDDAAQALVVPEFDPAAVPMSVERAIGHFPALGAGEAHPDIPNHRTRSLSPLNLKRLAAAKPGESNLYLEATEYGDLSLDCHRRVNARLADRCFTDVYTRMRPDRPSPTITTRSHSISNGRFGHYDQAQLRGISLREAAALQSFRDDYVFYPTNMIEPISRMIGNAVPPKLARFFGDYLASLVNPINGAGQQTP